ncbi:MAG: hypothetical protein JWM80_1776 [Cyanobacteria bacterium RYN_339]|nr:hypothetical protein [Cyanobacteria bacterium RYN_339]
MLLALAACQAVPAIAPKKVPSVAPSTAVAASTPTAAATGGRLQRPSTPVVVLGGKVQVDAGYIVGQGAGKIIANNGGAVLAAGTGLVQADGKLTNAGALVAEAEGNVIANNASSIISDNGAGVIANNGSNLTGKVKRQLFQATDALVPAAGMALGLRSLRSGQALPVGVDAGGNLVYAVYTNLAGGYELYVPAAEAGNVLLVANTPGQRDLRQRYDLLATTGASAVVDDDSATVTRLIRESTARRYVAYLTTDPARVLCLISGSTELPAALKPILQASLTNLYNRAKAHGVSTDPAQAAAVYVLAQRCADTMLAAVDLNGIVFGEYAPRATAQPTDPILPRYTRIVTELRQTVSRKLAGLPTFFETQPYFVEANACDPGRYQIRKPADLATFITDEYIANLTDPSLDRTAVVLGSLTTEADGKAQAKVMSAVLDAMTNTIAAAYVLSAHGEADTINALVDGFDPLHPLISVGDAPYVKHEPCPRATQFPDDTRCQ